MRRKRWVDVGGRVGNKPPEGEKAALRTACNKFIAEILRPRFRPEIRPTEFNYPIAIYGKWRGNKFRFIERFRSDRADMIAPEFETPFARLEYVGRDHFDLSYNRHIGEWFRVYRSVSLPEALQLIEVDGHFHPV